MSGNVDNKNHCRLQKPDFVFLDRPEFRALSSAEAQRVFSCGEDPLSNVSAGVTCDGGKRGTADLYNERLNLFGGERIKGEQRKLLEGCGEREEKNDREQNNPFETSPRPQYHASVIRFGSRGLERKVWTVRLWFLLVSALDGMD